MANLLPPGLVFPPPPPLAPPPPWHPPPSPTPTGNSSTSSGGVIAGVSIALGIFLFVLSCMCSLARANQHHSRANATADATPAAAAIAARLRAPPEPDPWDNDEQQLPNRSVRYDDRPRRASLTAGLPSFTYNRTVRHNVMGSGEEAETCSVCLGAFQIGETVRLLPVCLHLFHVECIDPWLDVHSTCPICRSGTDLTTAGGPLPPA